MEVHGEGARDLASIERRIQLAPQAAEWKRPAAETQKTRKNLDISYFYFSLSGFLIETFRHPKKSATERKFITLLRVIHEIDSSFDTLVSYTPVSFISVRIKGPDIHTAGQSS